MGPDPTQGQPKKKLNLNQQFRIQEQIDKLQEKLDYHEKEASSLKEQIAKLNAQLE